MTTKERKACSPPWSLSGEANEFTRKTLPKFMNRYIWAKLSWISKTDYFLINTSLIKEDTHLGKLAVLGMENSN